jgi:hypothetical protein
MLPAHMPSDTISGDDLARRGDKDIELSLHLDGRGDGRRPHAYRRDRDMAPPTTWRVSLSLPGSPIGR